MKQYMKLQVFVVGLLCSISSFFVGRFALTLKHEISISSHGNQMNSRLKHRIPPVFSNRNQLKTSLKHEIPVSPYRNQLKATLKHEIPVSSYRNQLKTTLKHEIPVSIYGDQLKATLKHEIPISSHSSQLKATLKHELPAPSHRKQLNATEKHEIPVTPHRNQLKATLKHELPAPSHRKQLNAIVKHNIPVSPHRNQLKASIAANIRAVAQNRTSSELIRLFKHAVSLNMSRISMCNIKTERFVLPQSMTKNSTHAYELLIPNWQLNVGSRPRTLRYFLKAVVRLRLYKEDKARWTMAELKQWIHYQLWAGTEHIYICNHYLKKEEKILDELGRYEAAGLVTVIDWSHIKLVPGSTNYKNQNFESQLGCYNYVKDKWGHSSTWMYALDMDENPYCPEDHCEGFLSRFLARNNSTAGGGSDVGLFLLSNYILHGQGDRSRDIHYDRINRITPKPPNGNVKTIFRANWTQKVHMHNAYLSKGRRVNVDPSKLRLLHYWGARSQGWGPDTQEMRDSTKEFNDVRETIAIALRHSLIVHGEFDAFSNATGP